METRTALLGKSSKDLESIHLSNGDVYEIRRTAEAIHLPMNPKPGDTIYISIQPRGVVRPSKIVFKNCPLLGDHEDILLDTIGNVHFRFIGNQKGWVLG